MRRISSSTIYPTSNQWHPSGRQGSDIQFLYPSFRNHDSYRYDINLCSAQTCRRFKDADLACFDAVIQGAHELELNVVGSVGMVEFLSWAEGCHSSDMVEVEVEVEVEVVVVC